MANSKRRINLNKSIFSLRNKKIFPIFKGLIVYALIALAALIFFYQISGGPTRASSEVPISQIVSDVKDGKIQKIDLEGDKVTAALKGSDQKLTAHKEAGESIYQILQASGVDPKAVTIEVKDLSLQQAWIGILSAVLPILILVGLMFLLFRNAREAGQGIFSFAQSRARLFTKDQPQIKFTDVAGAEEAKQELSEVVEFLKTPDKFRALGARIPKGVLMIGPAGTGKTLLSRAVAGEAGVPFFSIAGSEFMEMLVGVGAARVRDMFAQAKKAAPAIIFVDEIESIGRQRGMGISGGHDEREQTLNQILVEMDGFTPNDHVIVLAASVTGDTQILIKQNGRILLTTIGEFVDQFYRDDRDEGEKIVEDLQALGFEKKQYLNNLHKNGLYFGNSAFKKMRSVFRHKVNEIYEINYMGGKVRATGNHSVFVRTKQGMIAKPVIDLKQGDILVDLPYKANHTQSSRRQLRAYIFPNNFDLVIPIKERDDQNKQLSNQYQFVLDQQGVLSQQAIAMQIGISQTTVGNWQKGVFFPRSLSDRYFKHKLPDFIHVTPDFCRLLGYYTAEGYARKGLDFCFSKNEISLQQDTKNLMKQIFGILPDRERYITSNAINIVYNASQLTELFTSLCGKGAHNKHIPAFLFEAPREYFLEYLKGVILGDGYIDKKGKIEITSVSRRLVLELNWLCRMHGIKSYLGKFMVKAGRKIGDGKPLPQTQAFRLGIGQHSNPFRINFNQNNNLAFLPRIKSITKVPFNGFVYDLCGLDNEAFFGGDSPILLHNTNRPDLLDAALVRPGRFDRRVVLGMPDLTEREAIIKLHMKGKPFTEEVSTERLARRTVGFSGADLANMLNEAAILAARERKTAIDNKDLEEAATKEKLGPQRKRMQSEHDRKLAAYHEAGHAIVGHFLKNVDPVHRISIVSRGMSGGHTLFPPTEDRSNESKSRLIEQITAALGGQAAEELVFKDISTGAASDIGVATSIARAMVTQYGMSSLGPLSVNARPVFGIWRGLEEGTEISPKLHDAIDAEIKKIMDNGYRSAQDILSKHKVQLDKVAKALLDKETLESDEFESIVGKKKVRSGLLFIAQSQVKG